MKKIFSTVMMVAILALAVVPMVRADDAGVVTAFSGTITNNVTHTLPATSGWVKIDKQTQADVWIKFQGNGAGTGDIVTTWARSADGVSVETTPPSSLKFTNALNGTTAVIGYHQLTKDLIGSAHSLKLVTIQSYEATRLGTNALVGIGKKKE